MLRGKPGTAWGLCAQITYVHLGDDIHTNTQTPTQLRSDNYMDVLVSMVWEACTGLRDHKSEQEEAPTSEELFRQYLAGRPQAMRRTEP